MSVIVADQAPANLAATRTAYLLAELRCAALRARLVVCELDTIGVPLRAGWIDCQGAMEWLADECPDGLTSLRPTSPQGNVP